MLGGAYPSLAVLSWRRRQWSTAEVF